MKLPLGIHKEIPIEDYHAQQSEEEHYYSSSQLKTMLKDSELFHKEYILGEKDSSPNTAFDIGHYFHTAILEPHLLDEEFAVFPGKVRRSKSWEQFIEDNTGKILLTESDLKKGKMLAEAVKNSPIASKVLEGCVSEVSCMSEVFVDLTDDNIYAKGMSGWVRLTSSGWVVAEEVDELGLVRVRLKVRSDSLKEGSYIADLKSSSGNVKNAHEMQNTTAKYAYDMSAAMYLDLFNLWYVDPMETFIWVYASKSTGSSKTWTSTPEIIQIGRAKWRKAVIELAKCIDDGWLFTDTVGEIYPLGYEKEWISKKF